MKITIITCVYNGESTLADTMESVFNQTHDDIEYILVDGASTDGTAEIIRSREYEISRFLSEADDGIYDGLNKGLAMATGDVVGFLHSDDLYATNDVIEKVAEVFSQGGVDAVYGDLLYVRKDDISRVVRYWRSGLFRVSKLRWGWMPPHPAFFVRRELYQKYGGFNTTYRISADYDCILRFLGKAGIIPAYLPCVLVKMRMGGESNRSLSNLIRKSQEDLRALRENGVGGVMALAAKNLSKIPQFFN
ncbi:MAG: glycosyltransferase family 2 protein [Pseudomonadales bacterium]